jgi:hypothetical protein
MINYHDFDDFNIIPPLSTKHIRLRKSLNPLPRNHETIYRGPNQKLQPSVKSQYEMRRNSSIERQVTQLTKTTNLFIVDHTQLSLKTKCVP